MICKMCFRIVFFIFISLFLASPAFSVKSGGVEYHDYLFDYSKMPTEPIAVEADSWLQEALLMSDSEDKRLLLHKAMKNYYILLKIHPDNVDYLNKRGLIYDVLDRNILARSFFSRSLNIDKNNPQTNFLVGDYFYKRRDFKRALKYFSIALQNGYSNYDIKYKLAIVYEKLGDLCNAKRFYQEAYDLDNDKVFLLEKIENIPEENEEYHGSIRG